MFELMKPDKKKVGNRLKYIKDELGVSFTTFGNRLGLKKTTINSYFQGYNLAPYKVIEKISKITNRSIGWFYFGEIEEYINDYLMLKGNREILKDYPNIIKEIKEKFYKDNLQGDNCKNKFDYPTEEFIDNYILNLKYEK